MAALFASISGTDEDPDAVGVAAVIERYDIIRGEGTTHKLACAPIPAAVRFRADCSDLERGRSCRIAH